MADRFEAALESHLAGVFIDSLERTLQAAGYEEVLRIPEPQISEYRRGEEVLTVQVEEGWHGQRTVAVESEVADVRPLVALAAKEVVVRVCEQLLGTMPWLEWQAARQEVEACLSRLLPSSR